MRKGEKLVMTIKALVKKLENDKELSNCGYVLIESWLENLKNADNGEDVIDYDSKLTGVFWGLYMAGYINDKERKCLIKQVCHVFENKVDELGEEW